MDRVAGLRHLRDLGLHHVRQDVGQEWRVDEMFRDRNEGRQLAALRSFTERHASNAYG
jgi:hypothetical protein